MKYYLTHIIEGIHKSGFALIMGGIMLFMINATSQFVFGIKLDFSFCSAARYLLHVEWCEIQGSTSIPMINDFIHRLLNVPFPWFMLFWGLVIITLNTPLVKAFGYHSEYWVKGNQYHLAHTLVNKKR
jgi:hypothetical protein